MVCFAASPSSPHHLRALHPRAPPPGRFNLVVERFFGRIQAECGRRRGRRGAGADLGGVVAAVSEAEREAGRLLIPRAFFWPKVGVSVCPGCCGARAHAHVYTQANAGAQTPFARTHASTHAHGARACTSS